MHLKFVGKGDDVCTHLAHDELQSMHTSVCYCISVSCLQSRAVAEFEGARSDLMGQLPAELPSKDVVHGLHFGVAAPEEVVAPLTEDQLVDSLVGLPWEFIINKDARQEWARMDRPFRSDLPQYPLHTHMCQCWQVFAATIRSQAEHKLPTTGIHACSKALVSCPMSLANCMLSLLSVDTCLCRLMVIKRLQRIGEGQWEQDNGTQQRLAHIR